MEEYSDRYVISGKLLAMAEHCNYTPEKNPPVASYDVGLTLDALRRLGFDLSRERRQGYEAVIQDYECIPGKVLIAPMWLSYSPTDIYSGMTETRMNGRLVRRVINPSYTNPKFSILRTHEWAGNRTKLSSRFNFLPDELNLQISRLNHKGVSLSRHRHSRCVMFDIDNHEYGNLERGREVCDITLSRLFSEFGNRREIFIERSFAGGYHVAFEFDSCIDNEDIGRFVSGFNTRYDLRIEACSGEKTFRLPGHFTYTPGITSILSGKVEFSPFERRNDWKPAVIQSVSVLPSSLIKKPSVRATIPKVLTYYRKAKDYIIPDLTLTPGNRDKVMWKLAVSMKSAGLSFTDYFAKLESSYAGSRDWRIWSGPMRQAEAMRCWNNARVQIRPKWNGEFISSTGLLPDRVKKLLSDPRVISYFNPDSDSRYMKVRQRSAKNTAIILSEILGKCIYEDNNPRKALVGSPDTRHHLEQGYQFPRVFLDRMSSHYRMDASCRRIADGIITLSKLFTPYKWNGLTGRYSSGTAAFCRQWVTSCTTGIVDAFIALCMDILHIACNPLAPGSLMCEVLFRSYNIESIISPKPPD